MPKLKTKETTKKRVGGKASAVINTHRITRSDAHELLTKMIDFEAAAQNLGIDFTSSRFKQLTASEREFIRAELIADYIRLSAGNSRTTPGYFEASLNEFCSKVCDMGVPSQELIGTYLAALDVVTKDSEFESAAWLKEAVQRTIDPVLHTCVDLMQDRTKQAA